jgi:hypothetical protein
MGPVASRERAVGFPPSWAVRGDTGSVASVGVDARADADAAGNAHAALVDVNVVVAVGVGVDVVVMEKDDVNLLVVRALRARARAGPALEDTEGTEGTAMGSNAACDDIHMCLAADGSCLWKCRTQRYCKLVITGQHESTPPPTSTSNHRSDPSYT